MCVGRGSQKFGLKESIWRNPFKIGTDGNRADLMTKFLDGERHHTFLGALPLVPGTRRTTEHLAVGALLLAARVRGQEEVEDGDDGWAFEISILSTLLVVVFGFWYLCSSCSRTIVGTASRSSQTDALQLGAVSSSPHVGTVFVTQTGRRFHVLRSCAERRTKQQIKTYTACKVCSGGVDSD